MENKFRIVEVKFTVLSSNDKWIEPFIPEIEYRYEYHVEKCYYDFFGLFKRWGKVYKCDSIERAERQIEYLLLKNESCIVIKEY